MESKWAINFEDSVYLIISVGLLCLIISWMLSVLLVSKKSFDYELLDAPSKSLISESGPPKGIDSRSPPGEPPQIEHSLNIHPLKVIGIDAAPNTLLPPERSSCIEGDCRKDGTWSRGTKRWKWCQRNRDLSLYVIEAGNKYPVHFKEPISMR